MYGKAEYLATFYLNITLMTYAAQTSIVLDLYDIWHMARQMPSCLDLI
jgi:hypothetical protein